MAMSNQEIRGWLREQGETVSVRGRIGADQLEKFWAAHPGERPAGAVRLLPGPDASDEDLDAWEDIGVMGPESDVEPPEAPEGTGTSPEPPEAVSVDPGPAHARKGWGKQPAAKSGSKPARITVAVRTDISAKISFALEIPGRVWQARDPACGGTFVEQRPAIADALTEIVCQSPDLVAWFSGSGGAFMLWLNLAAACWPVATVVMAHHVYHSLEAAPDVQQPDYTEFAA